jgi:hypothetical protein
MRRRRMTAQRWMIVIAFVAMAFATIKVPSSYSSAPPWSSGTPGRGLRMGNGPI